jgi:tetratricopeptide (TPR) repeat protein
MAARMVAVTFGVEDTNGWTQTISIYNFPGTQNANTRELDTIFPLFTVLAIREPLARMGLASDHTNIRINSPSDLVFLKPQDPSLSNAKWESGRRQFPIMARTTQEWKDVADTHFKSKEYFAAIVAYSYGLRRSSSMMVVLRLNRCLAHLRLENYPAALRDAQAVLTSEGLLDAEKTKALYRSGQAKYGAGNYDAARGWYRKCLELSPKLADATNGIQNCNLREEEHNKGAYDWKAIFDQTSRKDAKVDLADFIGPVKIVEMTHRGGGRGVVASDNIKAGELLVRTHYMYIQNSDRCTQIVSKSFASASASSGSFYALNFLTNLVDMESQYNLFQNMVAKVHMNPHLEGQLYNLYGGDQYPPLPRASSPAPSRSSILPENVLNSSVDVDGGQLNAIRSYNSFGSANHVRVEEAGQPKDKSPDTDSQLHIFPSYINHSCMPNADRFSFCDVMVIRAMRSIPKGEEVFLSYLGIGSAFEDRKDHLSKWFTQCDCQLCQIDRDLPSSRRNQRKRWVEQIDEAGQSLKKMRSAVKLVHSSYPQDYPALRIEAFWAQSKFTQKIHELAYEKGDRNLSKEAIQSAMDALDVAGALVTDRDMSSPSQKQSSSIALPISTDHIPYRVLHPVSFCIMISVSFLDIDIPWRAEQWLRAAIWSESFL